MLYMLQDWTVLSSGGAEGSKASKISVYARAASNSDQFERYIYVLYTIREVYVCIRYISIYTCLFVCVCVCVCV